MILIYSFLKFPLLNKSLLLSFKFELLLALKIKMDSNNSDPTQGLLSQDNNKDESPQETVIKIDDFKNNELPDSIIHQSLEGPINDPSLESSIHTPPYSFPTAFKTISLNALPLIIIYLALFSVRIVSLHYIKKRNNIYLTNATGIGNSLINVFCIFIYMSLNIGLTSRSAQAFGTKNYQLIGFYLHRAFIINTISFLPGVISLYWADKLCILMGFDVETAYYTQQMTSWCLLGAYFFMIYNTLGAYLNACDIFIPSAVALLISVITFWIIAYFLFDQLEMDMMAMAISFNVMQVIAAIVLFLYIKIYNPVPGSFFLPRRQSFEEVWTLFKHEFFVGSMVFLEWISYQIIFLFAGKLDNTEISALTIASTSLQVWFAVPLSLTDTVLAFMGNAMGEGNIIKAKNLLKAGVFCSGISVVIVEIFYVFFSKQAVEFFTSDDATIQESILVLKIYLLYYPADFIQSVLSSGLRAIGREKLGSFMFIICFYCIAIPSSYFLCFYAGLRDLGLIYGPVIGLYSLLIWLLIVYFTIDWEKQVKVVASRIKKDDEALCKSIQDEKQIGSNN